MYQGPVYTKWKPSEYFEYDNYRYIHFGTGPAEEYIKIAEKIKIQKLFLTLVRKHGICIQKNTAMAMINLSNIMIINNNEFSYLLKMVQHTKDDLLNYLDYIIVTCGSHGSVIYSKDGEKHF
ncbi:PfkB family carbohydrate kinase [Acidiplasma cupricumulans]|uniref:PfkB family carbohydrate kinase n=1 Tax=Acidiplasma cupricumulans TaxID=312540 RepID=UPI0007806C01|nr:PfkB family carbohydrate kinase [Acidiplasma cupricumulans]